MAEVVVRLHPVVPLELTTVRSNPPSKNPQVTFGVQQVADILTAELEGFAAGRRANVTNRIGIADIRRSAVTIRYGRPTRH